MLNVTAVRPHDDGSENGLYDVELGVADGTRIALEITSLQDETWHRARSALDPWASEFEGASLSRHWIAMAAAEGVRIRGLAAVLEPLLRDVEQAGVDEVNLSSADSISQLPQAAQVAASKLRSMHVHGVISWEEGAFPEGTPRIHVAVSTVAIGHAGVLGSFSARCSLTATIRRSSHLRETATSYISAKLYATGQNRPVRDRRQNDGFALSSSARRDTPRGPPHRRAGGINLLEGTSLAAADRPITRTAGGHRETRASAAPAPAAGAHGAGSLNSSLSASEEG